MTKPKRKRRPNIWGEPYYAPSFIATTIKPVIEACRMKDFLLYRDPSWSETAHVEITLTVAEIRRLDALWKSAQSRRFRRPTKGR